MLVQLNITISDEFKHNLHCLARARGWKFQNMIRDILRKEIDANVTDVAIGEIKLEQEQQARKEQP